MIAPRSRIPYNHAMTDSLDDAAIYGRLDPHGLRDRIAGLPEQIAEAYAAASTLELPWGSERAEDVAVIGMGGSGIGAALLQALAAETEGAVPVTVVRGYRLPNHVSGRTLVIASSNSGDTEETVAAFREALKTGATCVAITSGGKLAELARAHGAPVLDVPWKHEPRAALGWSFASLLPICARAGLLPDMGSTLAAALDEMRSYGATLNTDAPERDNAAKQLARRLHGRLPVIVGAEALAPVAYRWRTQINENASSWAIADELPEMDNNALAGFGLPQRVVPLLHVVLLRQESMHARNRLRVDGTASELCDSGVSAEIVDVQGESTLAQMLRGILLGDWTSYYLGLLNGVEPSPVEALGRLKDWLASQPPTG